ncbi:DUF2188 domain-containing protein [Desulfoscipio sp. XC116]|uniref:DUF2188 domain-containing protein n=1 Tax=Desulfoscipio sp. XC116 TaxID=3144975 RepID=UPI00325A926D
MAQKVHYVSPSSNDGWKVQKSGASRASAYADTKAEAVRIGKVISQRSGSALVIHGKDGKFKGK